MRILSLCVVILLFLLLSACQITGVYSREDKKDITPTPRPTLVPFNPTPTITHSLTPSMAPTPTRTPIPQSVVVERAGDSDTVFDFKRAYKSKAYTQVTVQNGYSFSIHQNMIMAHSVEHEESFTFLEIDQDKFYGVDRIMSFESERDEFNIYYAAGLKENDMSVLYSSACNEPIIDSMLAILKVEDSKIIYLAEQEEEKQIYYAYDVETGSKTDYQMDESSRFSGWWDDKLHVVDRTQDYDITYNENVMKMYSLDDHHHERCAYKIPIAHRPEEVIAYGDLIYLVYGEDDRFHLCAGYHA